MSSAGLLEFSGRATAAGVFNLEANAALTFEGDPLFRGEFDVDAASELLFTGQFVGRPGQGVFAISASADVEFAWVPKFKFPGSEVGVPDDPAEVIIKTRPGDIIVIGGVTGVVVIDSQGMLVVVDHAGEVLCILGPSGVEL